MSHNKNYNNKEHKKAKHGDHEHGHGHDNKRDGKYEKWNKGGSDGGCTRCQE